MEVEKTEAYEITFRPMFYTENTTFDEFVENKIKCGFPKEDYEEHKEEWLGDFLNKKREFLLRTFNMDPAYTYEKKLDVDGILKDQREKWLEENKDKPVLEWSSQPHRFNIRLDFVRDFMFDILKNNVDITTKIYANNKALSLLRISPSFTELGNSVGAAGTYCGFDIVKFDDKSETNNTAKFYIKGDETPAILYKVEIIDNEF